MSSVDETVTCTRAEAASIIGVSETMIDNYIARGLLTNIGSDERFGKKKLLLSEVMSFIRPTRGRPYGTTKK